MLTTIVALVLATAMSPALVVSRVESLRDGEQIVVSGTGFPAQAELTVGECSAAGGACNEQGGTQIVTTDAKGAFGPVPIVVALRFQGTDCARTPCEIVATGAGVAPARVPITFEAPSTEGAPSTERAMVTTGASAPAGPGTGGGPLWVWLAGGGLIALLGAALARRRRASSPG